MVFLTDFALHTIESRPTQPSQGLYVLTGAQNDDTGGITLGEEISSSASTVCSEINDYNKSRREVPAAQLFMKLYIPYVILKRYYDANS